MPKNLNTVSIEAAERFAQKLADAPVKAKTAFTPREFVQMNKEAILDAVSQRGYSYQDIAKWLTEEGANISVSTLRSYLRDPKKRTTKSGARVRTTPKNNTAIHPRNANMREKEIPTSVKEKDVSPHDIVITPQDQKQQDRIDSEQLFNKFGGTEGHVG